MRRPALSLLLGSLLACGPATVPADLAITNASVVDVESGNVLQEHTVLVADGRIVALGPTSGIRVAEGAWVIDATGMFVIPGLWDAHVHSAAAVAWHFPLLVAHGVTSVRNMHTGSDTALALVRAIKQSVVSGAVVGPRFLANGALVDGRPPVWPGSVVAGDQAEGRAAVDSLAAAGADFIKVYDRLSPETHAAILDQARRRGIPVDGHVPFAVLPEIAAAGHRTVEHTSGVTMGCSTLADSLRRAHDAHLERLPTLSFPEDVIGFFRLVRAALESRDPGLCEGTVRAYKEHGVAVVPTLVVNDDPQAVLADSARMRLLPPRVRAQWTGMASAGPDPIGSIMGPMMSTIRDNVRMLHTAGVTILAGTDLGNPYLVPGSSLHDELQTLVDDVGLSPIEALRTATVNPARVFGLSDSIGTVSTGLVADLVLLRSNPLDDIRNVRGVAGVVLRGRYLDADALERLVAIPPTRRPE